MLECENGRWGQNCAFTCSEGCNNNICDKVDGGCLCKPGFTGSRCESR